MRLPSFELHQPSSLDEAVALLREIPSEAVDILAGGSDLLPNYKQRLNPKPHVLSLDSIQDLTRLESHRIGAMVTLHELAGDAKMQELFPGLCQAAAGIASAPLRRQATCGGNVMVETRCFWFNQFPQWRAAEGYCLKAEGDICRVVLQKDLCYAMYPGELAPVLLCLDASLLFLGPSGERRVKVRDFFQLDGIAKNHRQPGEILVALEIPEEAEMLRTSYRKLAVRNSIDFAEAGIAAGVVLVDGRVARLELASTAMDMAPIYHGELCRRLEGREPDEGFLAEIQAAIPREVNPVKNTFLSPSYRKKMAGVFAKRAVQSLVP